LFLTKLWGQGGQGEGKTYWERGEFDDGEGKKEKSGGWWPMAHLEVHVCAGSLQKKKYFYQPATAMWGFESPTKGRKLTKRLGGKKR